MFFFSDLLFDGLQAFMKGSPNMNSLVGFGSLAAFAISAVRIIWSSESFCLLYYFKFLFSTLAVNIALLIYLLGLKCWNTLLFHRCHFLTLNFNGMQHFLMNRFVSFLVYPFIFPQGLFAFPPICLKWSSSYNLCIGKYYIYFLFNILFNQLILVAF